MAELDRRAVGQNEPTLRSLSDCVRLLCLPLPHSAELFDDYRRVGKALVQAFSAVCREANEELCSELEEITFGWAALPACSDLVAKHDSALINAIRLGPMMAEYRILTARAALRRKLKEEEERREQQKADATRRQSARGASC